MKKIIFYLMAAVILFTACNEEVETVAVTAVTLSESAVMLKLGEKAIVGATVEPEGATSDIVWSSSNPLIATVDQRGGIIAVAQGKATIIATAVNGRKVGTCAVYVDPIRATRVELNKQALYLLNGGKETIAATVFPENATNKTVLWSTSDAKVVTVSATGAVEAVGWGNATITATTQDGSFKAYCLVTVSKVTVAGITISLNKYNGFKGETFTLKATILPDNATFKGVVWSSSDETIATVTQSGVVTIHGEVFGKTAQIRASAEDNPGVWVECTVTITKTDVASVTLDVTSYTDYFGEKRTLQATVKPDNANFKGIIWSSNNEAIATVDQNGVVTCGSVLAGTVIIRATSEDNPAAFAECTVEVLAETATERLFRYFHGVESKTWTWNESYGAQCYGMGDVFQTRPNWWNPEIPGATERFGASMTFTKAGMTLVKDKTDGSKESGTFVFDPAAKDPNWRHSVAKFTTVDVTILGGKDYDGIATYEFQVTQLTATNLALVKLKEAAGWNPNAEGWGTACVWAFRVK